MRHAERCTRNGKARLQKCVAELRFEREHKLNRRNVIMHRGKKVKSPGRMFSSHQFHYLLEDNQFSREISFFAVSRKERRGKKYRELRRLREINSLFRLTFRWQPRGKEGHRFPRYLDAAFPQRPNAIIKNRPN